MKIRNFDNYLNELAITKIGFGNFRVFGPLTEFEIAIGGLTIVTGPNNSGKSSILKAIDLLQHSFKENKSFDIIDFNLGQNNLGGFDNAKCWQTNENEILFTTEYKKFSNPTKNENGEYITHIDLYRIENRYVKYDEGKGRLKSISLLKNTDKNLFDAEDIPDFLNLISIERTNTDKWDITIHPESLFMQLTGEATTIINLDNYVNIVKSLKPTLDKRYYEELLKFPVGLDHALWDSIMGSATLEKLGSNISFTTKYQKIFYKLENEDQIQVGNFENIYKWFAEFLYSTILYNINEGMTLKEVVQFPADSSYKKLEDLLLSELLDKEAIELFKDRLLNTGDLFLKEFVDCFMKFDTKSFHKVKSLREYNESLVDDNVMSGILKEYYEKTILEKDRFRNGFVDYFIHSFNIGESVNIIKTDDNFYKLEIYKNNRSISIADLGLGSLRVVSIILFLACRSYDINYVKSLSDENSSKTFIKTQKQILIIEEPESNLHPNWQSKMAELFIKTSNLFDINFIIETHSEYFIRNLQYLTAKHEINKDNSIIYNFNLINNIEKRITQIRKILILEDGMLSDDLGKGFFDEADRIAIDLYRLQRSKHQSN